MFEVELRFTGQEADRGLLDFYDASKALVGFQRSLALTVHLAINGEIITQAPSLSGAEIYFPAVEEGSWKSKAVVILGGAFALGSVGKDSPVGQMVTSLYDYVLSETMGFHPDYDKTLQQQYAEHLKEKGITKEKVDSLIEKTEASVAEMHRPVVASETAGAGEVSTGGPHKKKLGPELSIYTYEYVKRTIRSPDVTEIVGTVSSFNNNTYKGRLFSFAERRPIPFEILPDSRSRHIRGILTNSQHLAGQNPSDPKAVVKLSVYRLDSVTGRLKRLHVITATPGS